MIELTIGIVVTILLSAFFSGMEIAFVSSNRMLAEMSGSEKSITHRVISYFYKNPNTYVNTMLVGNNIVLVVYGIFLARLLDSTVFAPLEEATRVVADTLLSTVIILFTGEFLPKTLFKNSANTMLRLFAIPAWTFYILLYPISKFCTAISRLLLRIIGVNVEKNEEKDEFSKVDLDYLVTQSIDHTPEKDDVQDEVKIFQNALDLSNTKVRDCMIPRTEINAVDKRTTLEELRQKFIESGRTKIIVYDGDIDHIIGYIHSSELFRIRKMWTPNIRIIPFVPETMAAPKLMQRLLKQKISLAVVVDEFGGTSGIVSLEDIVEEVLGEIEDEHDISNYECRKTADGGYLISGRIEIERANDTLGINLPESDNYKTVGGMILDAYQSFPKLNEEIELGEWKCKIVKSTQTKIELVKLTRQESKHNKY